MSETPAEKFERELQEEVARVYADCDPDEDFSEPYGPLVECTDEDCPCDG